MKYRTNKKDYFEYKLKGVVVHSGTADYGHYYSYINYKDEKWAEFNDSSIRDFDSKKIAEECFGGKETDKPSTDLWAVSNEQKYSKCAYILVYERDFKTNIKLMKHSTITPIS